MSLSYRTYNSPGGPQTFSTAYVADPTLVMGDGTTGGLRPLYTTDFLGAGTGGSNAGTPGFPASGILTVQGAYSGYPIAIIPGPPNASSARAAYTVQSTFNRPNDNIQYTLGDVVSNSTTTPPVNVISGAALVAGRGGIIQNMVLAKTGTNVTNAAFNVHFYTYSGATIPGYDNFPMTGLYANSPYSLGYVSFPTMTAAVGAGSIGRAFYQQAAFEYTTTDTPNLYWILEANGAYTPAAGEGFSLLVTMLRD